MLDAYLLADRADLQRIDHEQNPGGILDMLAVQAEIILIHHTLACHIEEHQRQRRLGLIFEYELENKRLLHLLLLRGSEQVSALEQRLLIGGAELPADLGIQRHTGRAKVIGCLMLERMNQRGHIYRFTCL
ncbi:hypothetical protein D3C86_1482060 [compost metagenome]